MDYEALLEAYTNVTVKPSLIVCDAQSEFGKFILQFRDGETDFDGFYHAFVKRGDQTFLVPLWEWGESN